MLRGEGRGSGMARRKGDETSFATTDFSSSIHEVGERSKLGVQLLSRD